MSDLRVLNEGPSTWVADSPLSCVFSRMHDPVAVDHGAFDLHPRIDYLDKLQKQECVFFFFLAAPLVYESSRARDGMIVPTTAAATQAAAVTMPDL